MPASGAARPLYIRNLFISPRCRSGRRAGSRRTTTSIAGRSPAACASTCPPARVRPARPPIVAAGPIPPCGGADTAGSTGGGPCAVSPDRFPRARRCRCRRCGACQPLLACRCGASMPGVPRRRGSRARTAVTERQRTRWAGNGRLGSAGRQQCGRGVIKHFSLRFSHLRRKEACRDGLGDREVGMLPPGPNGMRSGRRRSGAEGGVR